MSTPKPCLMVRETETRIWGGRSLHGMFGVQGDGDEPIGETWELFDRQDRSSRIQGGGTLRELMEQHDTALLGRGVEPGYDGRFPLLFKFLDAQDALSVQVHPDDEQARPHSDSGKTEAWVVLDATDQARICRGFRPGVTREKFIDAVRAGGHGRSPIEDQLFSFRPKAGDCIYTPAGTVHSMGPGVVVFEVQQNSNITYRLYDWGRDRRMHIEQGLSVARVEDGSRQPTVAPQALDDDGVLLIESPFFRLRRYRLKQQAAMPTLSRFLVVTVVAGQGALGWQSGGEDAPLRLRPGDCALVPACVPAAILSPIGSLDVILTDPGSP